VLRLKQLDHQELIDVLDVAVVRWPEYSAEPLAQEHVTDERTKMSALVNKVRKAGIDSAIVESVKSDITPGISALTGVAQLGDIDFYDDAELAVFFDAQSRGRGCGPKPWRRWCAGSSRTWSAARQRPTTCRTMATARQVFVLVMPHNMASITMLSKTR
jgi:hypothetical protein